MMNAYRITLARTVPFGSVALPGDVVLARGQSVEVNAKTANAIREGLLPAIEMGALAGLTLEDVMIHEIAEGGASEGSGGSDPSEPDATAGAVALAEAEGIDLSLITGTGAEGRITKADVEAYIVLQGPLAASSE